MNTGTVISRSLSAPELEAAASLASVRTPPRTLDDTLLHVRKVEQPQLLRLQVMFVSFGAHRGRWCTS